MTDSWGKRPPVTTHSIFSDRPALTGAIYPSCAFYIHNNGLQIESSMKFPHDNLVMIKLCIRILKCYLPGPGQSRESVIQVGVQINSCSKVLMDER